MILSISLSRSLTYSCCLFLGILEHSVSNPLSQPYFCQLLHLLLLSTFSFCSQVIHAPSPCHCPFLVLFADSRQASLPDPTPQGVMSALFRSWGPRQPTEAGQSQYKPLLFQVKALTSPAQTSPVAVPRPQVSPTLPLLPVLAYSLDAHLPSLHPGCPELHWALSVTTLFRSASWSWGRCWAQLTCRSQCPHRAEMGALVTVALLVWVQH